jgi:hypothetical protein
MASAIACWKIWMKMIIISDGTVAVSTWEQAVSDRPFNAVVCRAGPCAGAAAPLLRHLGAATRRCPHGVLISTGCVLRASRCLRAPGHDSGAYLLVQPCDLDRQPRGIAIGIGPVLSDADAAAVADWLAGGSLDAARLEPRLRLPSPPAR